MMLGLVAVAALLVTGCGGGDDNQDPPATPDAPSTAATATAPVSTAPAPPRSDVPAVEGLREVLLTAAELGGNWTSLATGGANAPGSVCGFGSFLLDSAVARTGVVLRKASADLRLDQVVVGLPAGGAEALMQQATAELAACEEEVAGVRISFAALPRPTLGDEALAFRQSLTSGGVTIRGEVVLIRRSSLVSIVAVEGYSEESGVDRAFFDPLLSMVDQRLFTQAGA